jgi:hypothetical protein
MKIKISLFLFVYCIALSCRAQSDYYVAHLTYEAGISIGPMNSLTDIGGRNGKGRRGPKDLNIKSTTLYGSLYGMAIYKHSLALRLEGTVGSVKSYDSLLKSTKINQGAIGRYSRNLSFRSPIYELSLTAEFHPIDFFGNTDPERYPPALSPYLIGGVGVFHFNPQANLNGKWIDLRPLHTEGEGFTEYPNSKEYKLTKLNVPVGAGIYFELSPSLNLRIEYINRMLFTDYLDDVHNKYIDPAVFQKYLNGDNLTNALILNNRGRTDVLPEQTTARPGGRRGNPLNNDSYFTINFKVGYAFGRNGGGGFGGQGGNEKSLRRLHRQQRSCPKLF